MTGPAPLLVRWAAPIACLCMMAGLLLGYQQASCVPALIACVLALLGAVLHRGLPRRLCALALMLSIGAALGFAAEHPLLPEAGEYQVTAVVSDTVHQRADGQVRTLLHHITLNGRPFLRGAYWSFYADELPAGLTPGAQVSFTARLYHPSGAENPGGYDFRLNLLQQGVTIGLYGGTADLACRSGGFCVLGFAAACRHALSSRLCAMLGPDAGAYASSMLLGERSLMPDEDMRAFRRMGIGHVLSVSGYHVGVLTALITGLLYLLRVPRRRRLLCIAPVLACYCLLTGLHPPVIRASLLVVLGLYGAQVGATPLRLHWLAMAAMLQLLVSPIQLLSASFQLTYGALLGVILVTGFLRRQLRIRGKRVGWYAGLFAALGAQFGVLLPQLYWFHELPVLGILANCLLLGGFSVLMGMYWLCFPLMLIPGVSAVYGALLAQITALFSSCIQWLSQFLSVTLWTRQANLLTMLGWVTVLIAVNPLWQRWGKRQGCAALAGLVLMACSMVPWPAIGVTYTQLSVGDADAAVLRDDGVVVVIDAGEGSTLASYLHARRMSVDLLVLTHLHADHISGLSALMESGIPIRRCILPQGAAQHPLDDNMLPLLDALQAYGTPIEYAARGDAYPLPHGQLTVLWPEAGRVRANQSANDHSLALLAQLHHTTLLLAGDLSGAYERYAAVPADILKAAHHGSSTSTGEAFLSAVQPGAVLQSCGSDARVAGLRSRLGGIPLYATQEHGAITLTIDEAGCSIQPYLP